MNKGKLVHADPRIVCDHLIVLLKGNLLQDAQFGLPPPSKQAIDEHVRQAVRCFLYGYQPRTAEAEA